MVEFVKLIAETVAKFIK
ncbi:hypothetical protein [Staphylococcus pseudintermedius]